MSFSTVAILLTIGIKWLIGLGPYSGMNSPPSFGDFEAQRHWLEVTNGVPSDQWYSHSPDYWPLDYPPLTAWHSALLGKIASCLNTDWIALNTSRGNEDPNLKLYMRLSVITSELLILVPGILQILKVDVELPILLFLIQPCLIMIDNGHFQYNSVMIGFFILSIACFFQSRWILGCIFFSCSVLFKQMGLFWALPVFFYLLGQSYERGFSFLLKIATTTLVCFSIGFASVSSNLQGVLIVLNRIFPVKRGLWEDKVANFWCASNVFLKSREIFPIETLIKTSLITTLLVVLPACLLLARKPNQKNFIISLCISSLGFYLFSFQVHEKSILIPAFTINLLWSLNSRLVIWFNTVALYSIMPLLIREGLGIQSFLLGVCYHLLLTDLSFKTTFSKKWDDRMKMIEKWTYLIMTSLLFGEFSLGNPSSYPHLFTVVNVEFSACMFLTTLGYLYYLMVMENFTKKKKSKTR